MIDLTSIDLKVPHTVVIVTSRCRLPFARGMLGPGVYHFPGDYHRSMKSVSHKKQLKACEIYYLAGDTESALKQIAKLKGEEPEVEVDETDPSAADTTNGGVQHEDDEELVVEDDVNDGSELAGGLMAINPDRYEKLDADE